MKNIDDAKSILIIKKLYFKEIEYKNVYNVNDVKPKIGFAKDIKLLNEDSFVICLSISVKSSEYELMMKLNGEFEVSGGLSEENSYLEKNAVAIMFPYIRSQLTLMTSQPGIKPIILPSININELMKK